MLYYRHFYFVGVSIMAKQLVDFPLNEFADNYEVIEPKSIVKKFTRVSLSSYAPTALIETVLQEHNLRAYAYCHHDKDEGKEPHTHILIFSRVPCTLTTFCNWFACRDSNGIPINTFAEPLISAQGSYEYLIHQNNPDKFQYPLESRVVYNEDYILNKPKQDKCLEALIDILENNMSLYQCARKYGRDFIFHYSQIKALVEDICTQEGIYINEIFNKKE